MSFGKGSVDLQCLLIRGDRPWECLVWSEKSALPRASDLIGVGKTGIRSGIRRVPFDSNLKILFAFLKVIGAFACSDNIGL